MIALRYTRIGLDYEVKLYGCRIGTVRKHGTGGWWQARRVSGEQLPGEFGSRRVAAAKLQQAHEERQAA